MERTVEPELMEREDQVDSYAKADFSEGENNLISQINHYLIKNNIHLSEKELIVDLGCGPGNISEKLSTKWPNANVIGIDGSKEMIRIAELNKKNSLCRSRLKNLSYICADIKSLKLSDISFKFLKLKINKNGIIKYIE